MRVVHETIMRPMRALKVTPEQFKMLRFPLYVSPKMDGIRCIVKNGFPLSRKLIRLPNKNLQKLLSYCPEGFEGELILGNPLDDYVFDKTQSCVMSNDDSVNNIKFYVFDNWVNEKTEYEARLTGLKMTIDALRQRGHNHLYAMPQRLVRNIGELTKLEDEYVNAGYEGIMLRSPYAYYKFGIATIKKGELLKLKRWHDTEAKVIDVIPQRVYVGDVTVDDLGYIKQSYKKADRQVVESLGAFVCELSNGTRFKVGNGLTFDQRALFWANRNDLIGKWITFRFQDWTKTGAPRFPSFLHFRDEIDFEQEV